MELNCKRCAATIPASNINVQQMVAVCPACDAVWHFEDDIKPAAQRFDDDEYSDKPKRKNVSLPSRMTVNETAKSLHISYKWGGAWEAGFMTFFTVFWCAISFTVAGAFFFGAFDDGFSVFTCVSFVPLLFVFIGLGLAYYTLGLWVNSTYIDVSDYEIHVHSGPVPWMERRLEAENIGQLYVKQVVTRNDNSTSISYDVRAVMHSGPEQKLVTSMKAPDQAFYIEERIEYYLEIADQPVAGEYRGYR